MTETTTPRTYTTGVPVTLTVHDDGRIEIEVDLTEVLDNELLVDDSSGAVISEADLQTLTDATSAEFPRYLHHPQIGA